jgi:broad specificity phosphatase PhoE
VGELILVRHAETALNTDRRYQGHVNPGLTPAGIKQARALAGCLVGCSFQTAWCSDLRRARQTALLALPGQDVRPEAMLRELDFGAFDGRTYEENEALHGRRFRRWVQSPASVCPPGGERLSELADRVGVWFAELSVDSRHVAVTHAGPIHMLLALCNGISFATAQQRSLQPCGMVKSVLTSGSIPEQRVMPWATEPFRTI